MLPALAILFLSTTPNATPPTWEKILLPVVTRGPVAGAYGSQWETVVTIRNDSGQTVIYHPTDCPLWPPVPTRFCLQNPTPELPPGVTKRIDLVNGGPVFLHVTPGLADRVFVQLRIHDLSRQGESFGTELPVVRSAQMKSDLGQILDIPTDPRFRLTFRLYGDVVEQESEIAVRFINETTSQTREVRYTIQPLPPGGPTEEALPIPALYRQISDFASYPELQGTDRIRIEIAPQTDGMHYWAFVSVTNNETQQITTLSVR